MIYPGKMKRVQLTVLKNDINAVIECLGRRAAMHFAGPHDGESAALSARDEDNAAVLRIQEQWETLRDGAAFLGIEVPRQPEPESSLPGAAEIAAIEQLCAVMGALAEREDAVRREQARIEEALSEAGIFSSLNAPFSDLDQLSYLTLRVGRIDPRVQPELRQRLADRAAIIPLGGEESGRIVAASSRKGRFALDSELKNCAFEPIAIPETYTGVPAALIKGLEERLEDIARDLVCINDEKARMRNEHHAAIRRFASALLMSLAVEQLKARLVTTSSIYLISGWVPAGMIAPVAADLARVSGGRVAIRVYAPHEVPSVRDGGEQVPVFLRHGAFVRGFQGMVFSYGIPPYGTIDPTPLVAFFFTLLFGIMFGDVGQGFVLLLLGLLSGKRGPLKRFNRFSTPLIAVSVTSMIMGLLAGSVFTNEELLIGPTMMITGALTGHPVDRILHILPMAEKGGSVTKLFYLFGFTIGIGVIINSLGLLINIINCFSLKKYEAAIFSKTGLAGLLFFWYALFIAIRCILGGRFEWFDIAGLLIPAGCIFLGPVIWRGITGKRPVLKHRLSEFIMEGVMEVWETASGYFSNTASFLRVGAFALSHAVLAYIVFYFSEELIVSLGEPIGSFAALCLMLFGNSLIIVLEGLIVAIQVLRLQYYEFFGKFFTERGVLFVPFRFRMEV